MGGIHIYRAVIIKCRIERHSCSHARSFNLSFVINFCAHCIPRQQRHGRVGFAINPATIDSMCNTERVDGGCRSFKVRIMAVDKLMPEPLTRLVPCQTPNMLAAIIAQLYFFRDNPAEALPILQLSSSVPSHWHEPNETRMCIHTSTQPCMYSPFSLLNMRSENCLICFIASS
jgi:hypothetical protein